MAGYGLYEIFFTWYLWNQCGSFPQKGDCFRDSIKKTDQVPTWCVVKALDPNNVTCKSLNRKRNPHHEHPKKAASVPVSLWSWSEFIQPTKKKCMNVIPRSDVFGKFNAHYHVLSWFRCNQLNHGSSHDAFNDMYLNKNVISNFLQYILCLT